jgi:hypothetical protein
MGLEGYVLLMVTLLLGYPAGIVVSIVVGSFHGRWFRLALEPDPSPVIDGGGILHLDSSPTDRSK